MRTRDANKEEIVKRKAIEMIVARGIEGFGMNRLAKECEISVATLYIYYSDKDDLVRKIGIDLSNEFFTEMLKNFSPEMSFREGLYIQWENRARFAIKNAMGVACYELLKHSSYGEDIVNQSNYANPFKDIMKIFFQNAVKNKELIDVPLDVFWSIAYGPLYTLLRFHNEGKSLGGAPFKLTKKIQDEAFELVIKALTP
jgi:TetR/AcrR family transcriptional regulator, multidrug resistance operon repressor